MRVHNSLHLCWSKQRDYYSLLKPVFRVIDSHAGPKGFYVVSRFPFRSLLWKLDGLNDPPRAQKLHSHVLCYQNTSTHVILANKAK
jgi:hypothetical protein